MKKVLLYIVTAVAIFTACAKESYLDSPSDGNQMVFHAYSPETDTKTVRMSNGAIYWSPSEKIKIFHGKYSAIFTSTSTSTTAYADFAGSFPADDYEDAPYYAVYTDSYDGVELTVTTNTYEGKTGEMISVSCYVPYMQAAPSGSFAPGSFPSVATAKGSDLYFENLCGGAVVSVSRPDIREIIIRGNNNEAICGRIKHVFYADPDIPFLETLYTGNSSYSVTLMPSTGGCFIPGNKYYVSLNPKTLTNGLTITYVAFHQRGVFRTEKEITISRSKFGRLINLDEAAEWGEETANCYVVKPGETITVPYEIPDISNIGSGLSTKATPGVVTLTSIKVLWESFGTSQAPKKGDVVASAKYGAGRLQITAGAKEGNAVIAEVDQNGEIQWSWHIWVTSADLDALAQEYGHGAGVAMDRNLGALSNKPGDVRSFGLYYEWGRKDPFPASSSMSKGYDNKMAATTITWPSPVRSNSTNGTIAYSVSHPTTFIGYNNNNNDWLYSSKKETDMTRWNSNKGLFDPCPAGWQVPDNNFWTTAMGSYSVSITSGWNESLCGIDLASYLGVSGQCWYPATGYLMYPSSGSNLGIYKVAEEAEYWTCSPYSKTSTAAAAFDITSSKVKSYLDLCGTGNPVRCVKRTDWKTGDLEGLTEEPWGE